MREEEYFEEEDALKLLLNKAAGYCARAEKSPREVEQKLRQWGEGVADEEMIGSIMSRLRDDNFINEERYARAYISDKRRLLLKGPVMLRAELSMQKGITDAVIMDALSEVAQSEWEEALEKYLSKKVEEYRRKARNSYDLRSRLTAAAYRRGFDVGIAENVISTFDLEVPSAHDDSW